MRTVLTSAQCVVSDCFVYRRMIDLHVKLMRYRCNFDWSSSLPVFEMFGGRVGLSRRGLIKELRTILSRFLLLAANRCANLDLERLQQIHSLRSRGRRAEISLRLSIYPCLAQLLLRDVLLDRNTFHDPVMVRFVVQCFYRNLGILRPLG